MGNLSQPTARLIPATPSSLWSLGMPPECMNDFVVTLLRSHFADANNIVDPTLQSLVWLSAGSQPPIRTDPSSPIAIEPQDNWNPALVESRPAIVVKDHAWVPQRQGIDGGRFMGGGDRSGAETFMCIYNSSVTIFCVHSSSKAAKLLGTEVTRELVQFASEIRRQLGLIRFAVLERGECAILEESRQNQVVPVSVAYQAGEEWRLEPQAARLRQVILDITTRPYRPPY